VADTSDSGVRRVRAGTGAGGPATTAPGVPAMPALPALSALAEIGDGIGGDGGVEDEAEPAEPAPRRPITRPSLRRISRPSFLVDLAEGTPVGEYEIQAQIGEGAMSTVYSAIHPLIGKTVAIKVLKPELCANQATVDRFVQEAQAVNRIGHPNIVDVYSLGELPDGRAYMVMEWLRGEALKARVGRGPLPALEACEILDAIAQALEAAHGKDIVHRDLKPDNVFLHQIEGGPHTVKLLDFGIAKLMRTQAIEKTQTGSMLGTPSYISPEQARGVDVTPRSDIYSLGVMAYEMLSGRLPFEGETAMDLVVKHLNEEPPPLGAFVRVPRALETCVMRMLAKDPALRPGLADIRQILADPTRRLSTYTMAKVKPQRRGRTLALALAGAAALAVGAVTAWQLVRPSEDARAEAMAAPAPAPAPAEGAPAAAAPPSVPAPTPAPAVEAAPAQAATAPTPPAEPGMLEIRVTGSKDAVILVDGDERGRGSALKVDLKPGRHAVEVRPPGGAPIRRELEIAAGEDRTVELDVPVRRPVVRPPPPRPRPPIRKPPLDEDELLRPKRRP